MLENLTPFAAEILPGYGVDGGLQRIVVVKATLDFRSRLVTQSKGLPILRGDQFFDAPGMESVVRFESDLVPFKPRVDVIVNAVAYAPGGKPVASFDAGLQIGRESRTVRVFGERVWRKRLGLFPVAVEQAPALRVPVAYHLAYGGQDPADAQAFAPGNPTGLGFSAGLPPDGWPLPRLEWPDQLIRASGDTPVPAGFGCFGRTWLPRRKLLGSYGPAEWQVPGIVGRMPQSFDPAAWNCAHPRMQFSFEQVKPGTSIQWVHLSAQGPSQITLPDIRPCVSWTAGGKSHTASPHFDTVTIEPEHGHFALTWRHALPQGEQGRADGVQIHL
ncbi:DUF2169 domain-containing protein [Acidovorax sp. SUPP2522]|uniref:DUF2169 family type VI secretion system accessory protein n=1 Tax=unclassified Acidovorax TaxID=2684926 RepID=UPI002349F377|nr:MULTISPECIES: DUF2169 domain-containing protein [unclassified Acidovorax]WCM96120.1 DUF2169 domain-containing protein [Acidovorax sp. GBBC 1281]GKT17408.1 DUF2169 domain-containing protein [Acidovorax sp. SUPP2522]